MNIARSEPHGGNVQPTLRRVFKCVERRKVHGSMYPPKLASSFRRLLSGLDLVFTQMYCGVKFSMVPKYAYHFMADIILDILCLTSPSLTFFKRSVIKAKCLSRSRVCAVRVVLCGRGNKKVKT